MKKRLLVIVSVALLLAGCTELTQILQTVSDLTTSSSALTEGEVISGLKEALTIGARNSSDILSKENGYYGDELVKILLPEQAQVVSQGGASSDSTRRRHAGTVPCIR